MAPCNGTTPAPQKLVVTLQHTTYSSKIGRHPAPTIAHYNGAPPPCTPPKLVVTPPRTIAHYNGTLQWHHVLLQSWSSPCPRNDSALQWHLAMAPSNGTTSTPPKLVVTLSPNHSTLQWHPTMAQQWHHVLCTLQWHPSATSNPPKWFVALPPIGSKNPYSYRYLGNLSAIRLAQVRKNSGQGAPRYNSAGGDASRLPVTLILQHRVSRRGSEALSWHVRSMLHAFMNSMAGVGESSWISLVNTKEQITNWTLGGPSSHDFLACGRFSGQRLGCSFVFMFKKLE